MCALAASFAHMKDIGLTTVFLYSEIYWIMCFTYVNFYMPGVLHRENKIFLLRVLTHPTHPVYYSVNILSLTLSRCDGRASWHSPVEEKDLER